MKENFKLGQQGQTVVEYVLLITLLASFTNIVLNSNAFKNLFKEDGTFIMAVKANIEYNYRHGHSGKDLLGQGTNQTNYSTTNHTSYSMGTSTYFFAPNDPYPQ